MHTQNTPPTVAVVRELTLADGTVRPLGWPIVRILDVQGFQAFQHECNPETGQLDVLVSVVLRRPDGSVHHTAVWASQIDIQAVAA